MGAPHESERGAPRDWIQNPGQSIAPVWRLFFLVVLFILFLLLLWKAIPVLILLFAGTLVAIAVRMVSDQISEWTPLPQWVSLTLVLIVLIGGGGTGLLLAWPSIAAQASGLGRNLKDAVAELEDAVIASRRGSEIVEWVAVSWEEKEAEVWSTVAGVFTTTFGAIGGLVLVMMIGIFLAYNHALYVRGFLRLIPIPKRRRAHEIIRELGSTLRWWMAGQLISMVFLALATWLMLSLMGIPIAWVLGILTGILTFVPYLGPLVALGPILLVSLAEGPGIMVAVLVLYLVIQNLETQVLMPIVLSKTVHMPPVLTIVAQVLMGAILGLVGIILATPLVAAGLCLVRMIYVEDVLGDSMERPLRVQSAEVADPPSEAGG